MDWDGRFSGKGGATRSCDVMVSVAEFHWLSSQGIWGCCVFVQEEPTLEITLPQMHWLGDLKTQTGCCTHRAWDRRDDRNVISCLHRLQLSLLLG